MGSAGVPQVVTRYFDALNRGDYAAIDGLLLRPLLARNIRQQQGQIASILSEVRHIVEATIAEGQEVWAFCTLHGVHTGPFESPLGVIPPTNRAIVIEQIYRFRLDGEKIDMIIELTDLFGLLVQLTM